MRDLEALLPGLLDLGDTAACSAIADALEEDRHQWRFEVRELANAAAIVTAAEPERLGAPEDEAGEDVWLPHPDTMRDSPPEWLAVVGTPELTPLACGSWWSICWQTGGVYARLHRCTPQRKMFWGAW